MSASDPAASFRPAGLFRRFAAGVYDGLLLLALAMLAGFIVLALTGGLQRPVGALHAPGLGERLANLLLFGSFTTLYFGYGWRKAGQSLGMKAWKIRVERTDGALLQWGDVLRRLGCAAPFHVLLLMAVLAMMLRQPTLAIGCTLPTVINALWLRWRGLGALQDRWSSTRVVLTSAPRAAS